MENRKDRADGQGNSVIGRRAVLKGATLVAGAGVVSSVSSLALGRAEAIAASAAGEKNGASIVAGAESAVAETISGKVAGFISDGIYTYKGIPYGASTDGANRFLPPQKPQPWKGVRSTRSYGATAPQAARTGWRRDEETFMFQWDDGFQGEDCLNLNVWTPGLNDGRKRPVFVWIHGGGFFHGSSHETSSYDGENLARRGDLVFVSMNHRLSVMGFLDLSQFGDKYARSGNVGMLDLVAALEWIRDNIAAFGGDPANVTIVGQSGGGAKVSHLMTMPTAKGRFHRAIIESGSFALSRKRDIAYRAADIMLKELNLTPASVDRIQTLSCAEILQAAERTVGKANPNFTVMDVKTSGQRLDFSPVIDGDVLPEEPFGDRAPKASADIPMIVGTNLNEFVTATDHPEFEAMTAAELEARTEGLFPGRSKEIIAAFRAAAPQVNEFELWSRIAASPVRDEALRQVTLKAAQGGAPAYLYWFTWQTPVFDRRPKSFHALEIPFAFFNWDRSDHMTGGGADAKALSERMADTWIAFARTGNPNNAGIPDWPAFSAKTVPTMIFDDDTRMVSNPDKAERAALAGK